jgi:hypothetical protein
MEDDHDDWRQRSERRRRTMAVVAAVGTLIAAVEPFLQSVLEQAAEAEPKPKKPRRERRVFDSCAAYNHICRTNLLDENALYSRDFEDFFQLSCSRVGRMLQDFVGIVESHSINVLESTCVAEWEPLSRLKFFCP